MTDAPPRRAARSGQRAKALSSADKRAVFLSALSEGLSVAAAAQRAGVARATVYGWRARYRGFAMDWAGAVEAGTDRLEDEARRRAVDGVDKPVFRGGEVVGHVRDYSDQMLMFLLKARRPDIFAAPTRRAETSHGGSADGEDARSILQRKFAQILAAERRKRLSEDPDG